jgi:asparagine synthase (glutamine-hydrolysing)
VVGFGFRRLSILDLSPLGHQPMVNQATGDALIFNGEIYNFVDLRRRLEGLGCRFRSTGDSEVLLHALSLWGEQALDEVDGMFALAFFHAATRRVLLARDPLGIKPLYIAKIAGGLVFGSEVLALLASTMVPADLDPAGIAGFLAYGAPQDPLTIHSRIRSLQAATCEWWDAAAVANGRPIRRRYWRFPAVERGAAEGVIVARIRRDLAASVQRQCAADVPLGVFLSGGIDSATVAALATSEQGPALTFAVGYDVPSVVDETDAAAETADALRTRHFQTIVDNEWAIMQWSEWLKAADRPSIDGLNTYIVSGAVKDRDVSVALSGLGADELFGGYPSFRRVGRLRQVLQAVAWVPRRWRRFAASRLLASLPEAKRAKLVDLVSHGASAVELTALSRRVMSDETMRGMGFEAGTLGLSPLYLAPEAYEPFTAVDSFNAVSQAELTLYMGNTLLRDTDINSMAHSLEVRVPFLGRPVLDYVSGLAGEKKQPRGAAPKHLLRRAMSDRLPGSVFARPKAGFTLPFGAWMAGPLRDQCEAAIACLADCSFMDAAAVRRLWSDSMMPDRKIHWSRPLSLVTLGSYLGRRARPTIVLDRAD